MIETLSNFENVSSVRDREAVLFDGTQNEIEMQVWTQRKTGTTNREMSELKRETEENLEKTIREVKSKKRTQPENPVNKTLLEWTLQNI